ncbi:MAG: bifunctional DNA primase/polymerase [Micromonosporaceae bacterium]
MWWPVHPRQLQRALLRRAALQYARHGWPVVPGAYRTGARFACDRAGCPTSGCHPAYENWRHVASCDVVNVLGWWARRDHSVLLATGSGCDVIEAPGWAGEAALEMLGETGCPVAITPTGSWLFFVRPGEGLRPERPGEGLRPELANRPDVVRHTSGSWVPAPPTRFPEGRVRWRVAPQTVEWRLADPYRVQQALLDAPRPVASRRTTSPVGTTSPVVRAVPH